jgi:hexosaminidase
MPVRAKTQSNEAQPELPLIPLPVEHKKTGGFFTMNNATKIYCKDTSLLQTTQLLNLYLSGYLDSAITVTSGPSSGNGIILSLDSNAVKQTEGYQLKVSENKVGIIARNVSGIIHGIQTLRQLWSLTPKRSLRIPCCYINDYPRFAYRGMALDVSRHMYPVSFIKKYIDLLSLYKFNTFHWHLTDDQGWRIEIKKYPQLQSVASWRSETLVGHKKEEPHRFDGKKYGGYYTQAEVREIVRYALQRNITVIPEIEMPGHALAALSAFPSLGCTKGPYQPATFWGIFDDVYCAGNDSTFLFLQDVLDEVIALFPSEKIHIGGDECPKTRWKICLKCQQRIKDLGLKDEHTLQSYFIQRIEKYINSKGRKIIGWDEIMEGGLAPNATVMSWRGEEGGIAAAKQAHPVIMTPESHLYFDYYQSLFPEEPLAAGGYTPLSKVYSYETLSGAVDAKMKSYITGVEGQAWSEYFTDTAKVEFMVFPRILALAEIAWSPVTSRNYPHFLQRLRNQRKLLNMLKVNYSWSFDEITWSSSAPDKGVVKVSLQSSYPGAQIRYTLDGTTPHAKSKLYTVPFALDKSCTMKAILLNKDAPQRMLWQNFEIHQAVGSKVILFNAPVERFNTEESTLVNAVFGNNKYNDKQWMGFSGSNLEAIVDLGAVKSIHSVGINFLNYHWQKMWPPEVVTFYLSTNGKDFTKVYEQSIFQKVGINKVLAPVKAELARYIKVIAVNKGTIPAGEYGAGGKALLMADEIIIE